MKSDAPAPFATSPDDLQRRILAAIAATPAPTRPAVRRRGTALGLFGLFSALALFLEAGGVRQGPRPIALVALTGFGTALLAVATALIVFGRGRSMLGRPARLLAATLVTAPIVFLLLKVGVTALWDGMSVAWPARPGVRCLGLSLTTGAALLATGLGLRLHSDVVHPRLLGAALGTGAGMLAAALVDLWCPVGYLPHLLIGHLLPTALLTAAGALVGGQLLSLARRGVERSSL